MVAGREYVAKEVSAVAPPIVAGVATSVFPRHFRRQLHARGLARHTDETISSKGTADMNAIEAALGQAPFLGGTHPIMADAAAFGLIAPMAKWPMRTPVADYIKSRSCVMDYVERMREAHGQPSATL